MAVQNEKDGDIAAALDLYRCVLLTMRHACAQKQALIEDINDIAMGRLAIECKPDHVNAHYNLACLMQVSPTHSFPML